jgi:hypothetical protein
VLFRSAWLNGSRTYVYLGVVVSLGALALVILLGRASFPIVPLFMSACYWCAAFALWRTD